MSRPRRAWPWAVWVLLGSVVAVADETPTDPPRAADSAKTSDADEPTEGRIKRVVHNPPGDAPILGPRYAPVTIEFFADLSDYTTATFRAHERLYQLAKRHPLRLRIIYRLVRKARAEHAEAAMEAFAQGRFHPFLEEFYGRHRKTPNVKEIESISKVAGVDFKGIRKAWEDNRHAAKVNANGWRQKRFGLLRAPSILVNGKPFSTMPRDLESLETIYDAAYASASMLLADGVQLSSLYKRLLAERAADIEIPRIEVGQVDGPRLGAKFESQDNGFELKGPVDYDGPYSQGPRDAPAQIVLYCAIGTRNCSAAASVLSNLRAAYGDDLRIVHKPTELGLEDEQAESARELHIAADCAGEQGLFWPFLGRVQSRGRLPRASQLDRHIEGVATRADVDKKKFTACRRRGTGALERAGISREARQVGVQRVPSMVVGGRLYVGSLGFAQLSSLVEVELAPGILGRWLDE